MCFDGIHAILHANLCIYVKVEEGQLSLPKLNFRFKLELIKQ